jgi:hypothetical protein
MAHTIDPHDTDFVGDFIYHTVVAYADTPVIFAAGEFSATGRAWVSGKCLNCGNYTVVNVRGQTAKVLFGCALQQDAIHGHLRPAR